MIRNLLFDLGGVIMDIERQNCVDAFERLGLKNADSYFGLYAQTGIFMDIEDGTATEEQFHAALRGLLPEGTTDAQIDGAFMKFLTGIPVERLRALQRLRAEGYRIYLVSNTNPIMWKGMIRSEFAKDGFSREDYFDGMVTSFEARCVKPSPEIFHLVESRFGIRPEETLFFDDSETNVKAAEKLGFKGAVVRPGTEFTDYLPEKK